MTDYRIWVELQGIGHAEQLHTFDDEQAAKQFIVDQVQAGRTVRTEFAYKVDGGFTDPANIQIFGDDWLDQLGREVSAARERAQERTPDE